MAIVDYKPVFKPEVLRRLRVRRQLTQQDLANLAKLSLGQVNRLERGEVQQPHFDTVRQLAEVLGVESDELWEWPGGDS